ncbi:activating transcription factor 3 isoform X2 [Tribolium madens]|uniref:activating transcription factor 3 isoform X2 n=1 Tax=Tribolium madens TaxID=41895 RepID=UPI001CF72AD4|nr:activating transcription factor 3 isoform X2 [Tribolium madens]
MHNLNVNLASTAVNSHNLLMVDSACTTPRTPEILNSLIAMTNPMDNYSFGNNNIVKTSTKPPTNMSSDSNSSSSSQLESPTTNPPSVQQTCSQLIKAGLKLSIEQKRKLQSDGEDLLDLDKCKRIKKNECSESEEDRNKQDGLTPEDEERRRRRRERNKIAATKCRLKKREKTANLVNESETLETQNIELKTQLQELQNQKRGLIEMLELHRPLCQHNISPVTRECIYRLPPVGSVIETHSYSRPASVDPNFRTQNMEVYSRPASVGVTNNITYRRPNMNFKAESIVVEEVNEAYPQLTNLDNISYHYNSQCHNYPSQNYTASGMDNGCMA